MHAPDGFLNAGTALATGAISAGTIGVTLRQARESLADKQIPLAGVAAAFIFAAQMFNFPVAAGTTGHLLGGALAAILLGPGLGALVVTVVVVVQALVFADGGLSALGYNVLNMAVVPAFGGYAAYRLFRRLLPRSRTGVTTAAGLAAGASVVLSSMAFSLEWLFGATAPVAFDTVFGAMVGAVAVADIAGRRRHVHPWQRPREHFQLPPVGVGRQCAAQRGAAVGVGKIVNRGMGGVRVHVGRDKCVVE